MFRNPFDVLKSLYFQAVVAHYFENPDESGKTKPSYVLNEFPEYLEQKMNHSRTYYDTWQQRLNMNFSRVELQGDGSFKHFWATQAENRRYNIILLRVEDVDSWATQVQEGIPGWEVTPANEAEDKEYYTLYEQFKQDFQWTSTEVQKVTERWSLVLDTFYTQEEKDQILSFLSVTDEATARASRDHALLKLRDALRLVSPSEFRIPDLAE